MLSWSSYASVGNGLKARAEALNRSSRRESYKSYSSAEPFQLITNNVTNKEQPEALALRALAAEKSALFPLILNEGSEQARIALASDKALAMQRKIVGSVAEGPALGLL